MHSDPQAVGELVDDLITDLLEARSKTASPQGCDLLLAMATVLEAAVACGKWRLAESTARVFSASICGQADAETPSCFARLEPSRN